MRSSHLGNSMRSCLELTAKPKNVPTNPTFALGLQINHSECLDFCHFLPKHAETGFSEFFCSRISYSYILLFTEKTLEFSSLCSPICSFKMQTAEALFFGPRHDCRLFIQLARPPFHNIQKVDFRSK